MAATRREVAKATRRPMSGAMVLAAHQPVFLPWLGYLHKLARADVFVVSDEVQFAARNFQHRNRVKVQNGVAWLTVPLARGPVEEPIIDKRIAAEHPLRWRRRIKQTLRLHYGPAPWFALYAPELEEALDRPWERLVDLDLHLIELLCRWFGIRVPMVRASSLGLGGRKTDGILTFCRHLGADTYLSGRGGSLEYLDVDLLGREGISVRWQEFHHPVYAQRYPQLGFKSHLSALDLLFNHGPKSRAILLGEAAPRSGSSDEAHSPMVAAAGGTGEGEGRS